MTVMRARLPLDIYRSIDASGSVTCISYPGATASCADSGNTTGTGLVDYTFDPAGRMATMSDWKSHTTDFTPDADGNPGTTSLPNGDTITSSFDDADLLASTSVTGSGGTLAGFADSWYPNGSLESETDSGALAASASYSYDPRSEVTGASSSTASFGYDLAGDPTTYQDGLAGSFNTAGQLTAASATAYGATYGYDNVGDRTSLSATVGSSATFAYDEARELTSVSATGRLSGRMAVWSDHSLFVSGGEVYAAGSDADGQLGNGQSYSSPLVPTPSVVEKDSSGDPLANVVQVAGGSNVSLALDSSGTVWTWGSNYQGDLGDGSTYAQQSQSDYPVSVQGLPSSAVVQVSAGTQFVLALTQGGAVYSWGANSSGQLGNDSTTNEDTAVEVEGLPSDIVSVSAGNNVGVALDSTGHVWTWGSNSNGQLGDGETSSQQPDSLEAIEVPNLSGVTQVAAGGETVLALLSGGTVDSWGSNTNGELGDGESGGQQPSSDVPVQVSGLSGVVSVSEGSNFTSAALGLNGAVYAFGANGYGQYGISGNGTDTPKLVGAGASEVVTGYNATLESYPSGQVVAFGQDSDGELGIGVEETSVTSATPVIGVTASGESLTSATEAYDGDGLRTSETVAGQTAQFTWDPNASLPRLLSDGTNDYLYGPGGVAVEQLNIASGAADYFVQDALGSTRALLASNGSVATTFSYDAYGALSVEDGTATTPILFAGGYYDAATGLYYLENRYYDPETGEFLTDDPLVDLTGQPYSYAGGDPVNVSDPSGELVEYNFAGQMPCDPELSIYSSCSTVEWHNANPFEFCPSQFLSALWFVSGFFNLGLDAGEGVAAFAAEEGTSAAGEAGDAYVADVIAAHAEHDIPGVPADELPDYIRSVMQQQGYVLRDGRTAWWDARTGAVIIRQGNGGTIFVPSGGYEYFLKLVRE